MLYLMRYYYVFFFLYGFSQYCRISLRLLFSRSNRLIRMIIAPESLGPGAGSLKSWHVMLHCGTGFSIFLTLPHFFTLILYICIYNIPLFTSIVVLCLLSFPISVYPIAFVTSALLVMLYSNCASYKFYYSISFTRRSFRFFCARYTLL